MERNALVSLAGVIWANDVTVVVGKIFHLYMLCLPRGLCWLSDLAVVTHGVGRLFPIANKQVCYLKTNPSWLYWWRLLLVAEGVLWARPQLLQATSAGFAQTDQMALPEVDQGALTQVLLLAGGARTVSCRRQAVKSSRVGGNGWYF